MYICIYLYLFFTFLCTFKKIYLYNYGRIGIPYYYIIAFHAVCHVAECEHKVSAVVKPAVHDKYSYCL